MADRKGIIGRLVLLITGDNTNARRAIEETEVATRRAAETTGRATKDMQGGVGRVAKSWQDASSKVTSFIGSITAATGAATLFYNIGLKIGGTIFGDPKKLGEIDTALKRSAITLEQVASQSGRTFSGQERAVRNAVAAIDAELERLDQLRDALEKQGAEEKQLAEVQRQIVRGLQLRGEAARAAAEQFQRLREEQERLDQRSGRVAAVRSEYQQLVDAEKSLLSERERLEQEQQERINKLRESGLDYLIDRWNEVYNERLRRIREIDAAEQRRIEQNQRRELSSVARINNARFDGAGFRGGDRATLRELRKINRNTRGAR